MQAAPTPTPSSTSTSISTLAAARWAAAGAAIAVTLGAGGYGIVRATTPDSAATFVPITPCRLFDTRPTSPVGPRTSPIGEDDTFTIVAVGEQGNCDLPATATGVAVNMTALDATNPTFLTVWPAGHERPTASALNPTPGAPPAPNAVTTQLGADGAFSVYNRFGSVHVIADVVGYYTDHRHDDRYYTEAEVDALLAGAAANTDTLVAQAAADAKAEAVAEAKQAAADAKAEAVAEAKQAAVTEAVAQAAAAAPAAWKPIPSGVTVTGDAGVNGSTTGASSADAVFVELPGIPPVPLDADTVNFAPADGVSDGDLDCTGTWDKPTAPPGRLCLYLVDAHNVIGISGYSSFSERGFRIFYSPSTTTAGLDMRVGATWAYTAP